MKKIITFYLLLHQVAFSDYSDFYYKPKKDLDSRAERYLSGEYSGMLLSYPCSFTGEEYKKEEKLFAQYRVKLNKEVLVQDLSKSVKNKDLYGVLALSEVDLNRGLTIAYIKSAQLNLSDDKVFNSIISYTVLKRLNGGYILNDEGGLDKEFCGVVRSFIYQSRKMGLDDNGYTILEGIDDRILMRVLDLICSS